MTTPNTSRNEFLLNLGFDPTVEFHRHGFTWTAARIEWYIDGHLVYTASDSSLNPMPKAQGHRIAAEDHGERLAGR